MPKSQRGVELLFPARDKAAAKDKKKDAKTEKAAKRRAALLKKLKAIEKGGDINAVDSKGNTVLHAAARENQRAAVAWLVLKGAKVQTKNKSGKTPAQLTRDKSIRAFLEACRVDKKPLSEEEAKVLRDKGYKTGKDADDDSSDLARALGRGQADSPEMLETLTALIRDGRDAAKVSKWTHRAIEPLCAVILARHNFDLTEEGKKVEKLTPGLARLMTAADQKVGDDSPLAQGQLAMLFDDADTLRKLVEQHPDLVKDGGNARRLIACLGSSDTLQVLIQAGLDVKQTWDQWMGQYTASYIWTVLYEGARRSPEAIRVLHAAGTPLPVCDQNHNLIAADVEEHGYKEGIVDALIDAGVDINAVGTGKNDRRGWRTGVPPLIACSVQTSYSPKVIEHLLSKGAQVNGRMVAPGMHDDGFTTLHYAADDGAAEAVRVLVEHGADIHAASKSGISVSQTAANAVQKNPDVLRILVEKGAPIDEKMLFCININGTDPAKYEQLEQLILQLLDHGVNPKAVAPKGTVHEGYTTLMQFGWASEKVAQRLIDAGVDPNATTVQNGAKICALALALQDGRKDVAKYMQQRGAKMVGDLLWAAPENMQAMVAAGATVPADVFQKFDFSARYNHDESTPEHEIELTKIAKILKDAGAKPTFRCGANFHLGTDAVKALFAVGTDPNEEDPDGGHAIFRTPSADIIPLFLKAGVDVNLTDKAGNTLLMIACMGGNSACYTDSSVITPLLDAGARTDIKNKDGKTALQLAREKKKEKVVKLLEERGVKE